MKKSSFHRQRRTYGTHSNTPARTAIPTVSRSKSRQTALAAIWLPLVALIVVPAIASPTPVAAAPAHAYSASRADDSYIPPEIDSSWRFTFDDEFSNTSVDWSQW